MEEIQQALTRIFERHRIIFWYDTKEELQAEFEAVNLPHVEKIVLGNNQFGLKYRLLRQEPTQKFLLYHAGPPPADDLDNWLLDVQLAHGEFRADQVALWLTELELPLEFTDVVAPHADFFKASSRRTALKAILHKDDSPRQVQLKMSAVCTQAEPRLDAILENLLAELAEGKDDKIRLIQRCSLDTFLWPQTERAFGYHAETPTVRDFALALFQAAYHQGLGEPITLNTDAVVLLKRWQGSTRYRSHFERLSAECADILGIAQDLALRPYEEVLLLDLFEVIDKKILDALVRAVTQRTLDSGACAQIVRQRRPTHWYGNYQHLYEAVDVAAHFLHLLDTVDLTIRSLADGLAQYQRTWYELDMLYRQFIYHVRQAGQMTLLSHLSAEIENRYTNHYLLPLNDNWQTMVDEVTDWSTAVAPRQTDFFQDSVEPFRQRDNKVVVIISDALRYEVGAELVSLIRQEDRYEATLAAAVTLLPSFTQLGMAALLPHSSLSLSADGSTVLVDGQSSAGTENRKKILQGALQERGTAVQAEALLAMDRESSRALFRDHDVVYVYHNRIDNTGDDAKSEERVFDAVAATLTELITIIKKLANANASNMIITADHGFIYQHRALDESDFAAQVPAGQNIIRRNRRFVIGQGLVASSSFKYLTAAQAGLSGDLEILLPKSINRLRISGAGSRYVHGGATLQEIVVPVIEINKKRQSDISQVNVDILRGANNMITTNQLTVRFYQTEPVTDKVQSRQLRAGLYTQAGQPISNEHDLVFDFTSEQEREREQTAQFMLTHQADEANGQEIILRLQEPLPDTQYARPYKEARYTLRLSLFTRDFD